MTPFLSVAAAQPPTIANSICANARAHADAVAAAHARLVVFPELSLTGYELEGESLQLDEPSLEPLIAVCETQGSAALVGAPFEEEDGRRSLAMVYVDGDGARVVYRKSWLGDRELDHFEPGPGPTAIEIDGWRIGLAICKDTSVAQHVSGTAALGVDLFAAGLIGGRQDRAEYENRAVRIARTCRCPVVFANFAGATGDIQESVGGSAVWGAGGQTLARAGKAPGEVVRVVVEAPRDERR